jgi:ABC-type Fe3+ transport system permease subunit
MDDFIAALLCLPFIIPPLIVLIAIIASRIRSDNSCR